MRSIRTLLHQRTTTALLALAVIFAGWQCPARAQGFTPNTAQKTQQTPTGKIVWDHVGRVFLNPNTGQFVCVGYLVNIDPIDTATGFGDVCRGLFPDALTLRRFRG